MFNLQTSLLKHPERVKAVGKFSSYDYKKKNKKNESVAICKSAFSNGYFSIQASLYKHPFTFFIALL